MNETSAPQPVTKASRPYLVEGMEVDYTGGDGKTHKAKVTQVYSQTAARVESPDGKNIAIAEYSEGGEINTFQFPASSTASEEPENPEEANKKE